MSKSTLTADQERVELLQQQIFRGMEAQYQMGWIYKQGKYGMVKSQTKAMEYWKKAAALGHLKATCFLGELVLSTHQQQAQDNNMGTSDKDNDKNSSKPSKSNTSATTATTPTQNKNEEDGDLQYYLGMCCLEGTGGVSDEGPNPVLGVEWLQGAVEAGNVNALYQLALCWRDGKGVEQQADAAKKAYELLTQAASPPLNHIPSKFYLAQYYYRFGVDGVAEKNLIKAVELLDQAAHEGNYADAQNLLGHIYCLGEGARGSKNSIAKDPVKGATFTKLAAEQGHTDAQINLAMCYRHGWGVPQDYYQAVTWLHKAIQAPDCKKTGFNDLEDLVHELLRSTAKHGSHAQALEYCCRHGLGCIEKNSAQAKQILDQVFGSSGSKNNNKLSPGKRKVSAGVEDVMDGGGKKRSTTIATVAI